MVVTEEQAEAMLDCSVRLERIQVPNGRTTSYVTEEQAEAMLDCSVRLERIQVPNGRTTIYKCTSVYGRTVGGRLIKPKMKVHHKVMHMFNISYQKNPSGPEKQVSCNCCCKKFKNKRSMKSHWTAFHSGIF